MALPARHDINESYRNSRTLRVFRWLVDGDPANLTGWTPRLRIGKNDRLVLELNSAITLGGAAGTVTMNIPAGSMTATGDYRYVIDLIDPMGEPTRFVDGHLRVLPEFT